MARDRLTRVLMYGLVCLTLVLSNCGGGGGGGGGGGVPSGALAGTWFGTLEDEFGGLHTLQVTVNANNTVTGELVDGSATGVTHTVAAVSGQTQVFGLTGSDGTSGGFYVDSSFTHAVFADDALNIAVMQKGTTSLPPSYATSNAVGTWSGFEVVLDVNYDIVETYSSTVTIATYPTISGSNKYGAITGSFTDFDSTYGGFWGDLTSPISGYVGVFMTPDKNFAGGYSCASGGFWPEDCSFSAWNKQ